MGIYVMANQARLLEALRSSPTKNLDSEPAHERKAAFAPAEFTRALAFHQPQFV